VIGNMSRNNLSSEPQAVQPFVRQAAWWALILIVLVTGGMRFRLLDVPLERDEGEYAYGGQLTLQGLPSYQQLYSMKLPGIYAAYAGLMTLFGQTHRSIHLGLLLLNACTIVSVFFLTKRLSDGLGAAVAAASFAVLSISPSVQGIFANAEHFVILPAVGGAFFLLKAMDGDQEHLFLLSGLLFGIGFLMKQHGAFFIAFGGIYISINAFQKRKTIGARLAYRLLLFSIGALVPFGFTCLTIYLTGGFDKFWFLTFTYAKTYALQNQIGTAWIFFRTVAAPIGRLSFPIWMLAGIGTTALLWDVRIRPVLLFIAMFTFFSFAAICPGLIFRPHYFVMVLPSAALLSGVAVSAIANKLSFFRSPFIQKGIPFLLALTCVAAPVYQQRNFLFRMTPTEACRAVYGTNPFPESLEVAAFVKSHTQKDDRIAVIGSEPQIYFYSSRLSASGYIYMYPLMENHQFAIQMQKEMIREIESAHPKILVFINHNLSWLKRPKSNDLIFKWFQKYQAKYYKPVGLVNILADGTRYYWEAELKGVPQSRLRIAVFDRKT
jgi:hypothetical protein